jgi:hypothetical protein
VTAPASQASAPPIGAPPSRPRFGVGFLAPEEETPATIPSPSLSPEAETTLPDSPQGSADDWQSDEGAEPSGPAGTSSKGSATRVANPLVGDALRDTFRNGVIIAGDQAHRFLARTQGQLEAGLYRADEQDAANIGDPLAKIAARREGLGQVSPDTADLLAAMMGLAGYASKQIVRQQIAAKHDAGHRAEVQPLPTGDLT